MPRESLCWGRCVGAYRHSDRSSICNLSRAYHYVNYMDHAARGGCLIRLSHQIPVVFWLVFDLRIGLLGCEVDGLVVSEGRIGLVNNCSAYPSRLNGALVLV